MTLLIKKHYPAIIFAFILGALMVLPYFYFQTKLGSNFQGIWPAIADDETFYLARIKDIIDGHSFLSNAYLAEHKGGPPQQLFLAEWLLAQPLKLFDININTGHLAYNFLLPAIAFLLTYIALSFISGPQLWSLTLSAFLFFGLYLVDFLRPVSPQFNFIFWLTQFIFLWLLVNSQNNPNLRIYPNSTNNIRSIRMFISRFGLLSANALNFGFLFYIYPYYWTFYLIFFGLLILAYLFKDRVLARKIAIITIGGLVLAIPYFYLNHLSSFLSHYEETLTRLGMIYTRFPSGLRVVFWSVLGLAIFAWFLKRKIISLSIKTIFFISGITTSIVAANQHIVTGRNFEFSSHYDMTAIFFLVFAAAYLLYEIRIFTDIRMHRNKDKFGLFGYIHVFGLLIIVVIIVFGLHNYLKRAFLIHENRVYQQNYALIFEWLNKNTERDSVVYTDAEISRLIPVYTANNVYYTREANLFFISDDEVLDRFIINNFFEKIDREFITRNARAIYGVRYIDEYGHTRQSNKLRWILGFELKPEVYLPEPAITRVIERANELQKNSFPEKLKRFEIDYLIWDKIRYPDWRISEEEFKKTFETNRILIFENVY